MSNKNVELQLFIYNELKITLFNLVFPACFDKKEQQLEDRQNNKYVMCHKLNQTVPPRLFPYCKFDQYNTIHTSIIRIFRLFQCS